MNWLDMIILFLAVTGGMGLLISPPLLYFAWKYNSEYLQLYQEVSQIQAKTKQENQEAESRLWELLDQVRAITAFNYHFDEVQPSQIIIYDDDPPKKLHLLVLWTIYNELNGRCAYREVYDALKTYNQAIVEAGQDKIRLSEHKIRDIINRYSFDPEKGGPYITFKKRTNKVYGYKEDQIIAFCVIVPATTKGGRSKAMIPVSELLDITKPLAQIKAI